MQKHMTYQNNMKSKLENGEVIERFEKKFGFNLWKEVQGFARGENEPAEVKVGKGWINISNDVKQFIYYALNQQRVKLITEIKEKYPDFIYQEWVEVATPHNFEAGKINETAFDEFLTKLEEEG